MQKTFFERTLDSLSQIPATNIPLLSKEEISTPRDQLQFDLVYLSTTSRTYFKIEIQDFLNNQPLDILKKNSSINIISILAKKVRHYLNLKTTPNFYTSMGQRLQDSTQLISYLSYK